MGLLNPIRTVVLLSLSLLVSLSPPVLARQAAPIHVLRFAAGPAGVEEKGNFRLTEERSTFSRTSDRELIVFFQWEGSPGPHKLVARWLRMAVNFTQ